MSNSSSWVPLQRNEIGLLVAVLVVVGMTIVLDTHRNYLARPWPNAEEILRQTAMLGIFALGSAIVIISGGIDLSCGSVIAFSGAVCAATLVMLAPEAMRYDKPLGMDVIAVAIAVTMVVGFLIGSLHAVLITQIGLPPFVATLATLVGLRSLGRILVENVTLTFLEGRSTQIQVFDETFREMGRNVWIPVTVFAVLIVLTWVLLSRTVIGRHLYAMGGNEEAAKLSGIRTNRLKWLAYAVAAMLSSLAGILYIGDQAVADPQTLGRGYELNAIAAAVVGGCSLQGGIGTVPGTVLGVLFLRVVIDAVAKIIKVGSDLYEGMIVGLLVVLAVALNQLQQNQGGRRLLFWKSDKNG